MGAKLTSPAAITVTSAGTAVALGASSVAVSIVYVTCPSTNTGNIWVGDSTVLASSKRGVEILKGTTQAFGLARGDLLDLAAIFVDAVTTNDKASIVYIGRST